MTTTPTDRRFRFAHFELDSRAPLLTRGTQVVDLAPKTLQILAVLVERAGRLVTKDDLLTAVWPGEIVDEGNLAVHVSLLRKAFGNPAYIATIPKRGYRFAVPVARALEPIRARLSEDMDSLCRLGTQHLHQGTPRSSRVATALYTRYLRVAGDLPLANSAVATAVIQQHALGMIERDEAVSRASPLLARAKDIEPSFAPAIFAAALLHSGCEWEWDRARDEGRAALEFCADSAGRQVAASWVALATVKAGDVAAGLCQVPRFEDDLSYPLTWCNVVDAYTLAGDFRRAAHVGRKVLCMFPNHCALHFALGKALTGLGDFDGALKQLRRALFLGPSVRSRVHAEIAYVHAVAGNREHTIHLLNHLESRSAEGSVSPVRLARIYTALSNFRRALELLDKACAKRDWHVSELKQDLTFDALRSLPAFRSVIARIGF